MRVTKEEATRVLILLEENRENVEAYLFLALQDFIRSARSSLPTQAAVLLDRQRGKKKRSAAQTG
jgi:hypothetical protein